MIDNERRTWNKYYAKVGERYGIRHAILFSKKRMEKLAGFNGNVQKLRAQLEKYIVAENQIQHCKLNDAEISMLVAEILEEV